MMRALALALALAGPTAAGTLEGRLVTFTVETWDQREAPYLRARGRTAQFIGRYPLDFDAPHTCQVQSPPGQAPPGGFTAAAKVNHTVGVGSDQFRNSPGQILGICG